eukprot:CAMPEP_0201505236 /NCGR_PEP_ID=MMETSP0151_2-20130828/85652_1 /ASSEMBLY_ACC=CAM_ASM_000257 /TAXON_ID=200890 /ORGANISM="Paramoeba atlantica, Strain 621/1 / CCAP 1560/9" /LENGTH=400 /DNA_ID=CAMNT_0047899071 /DNA_START=477 /DNA_END=1679 /DNA_ORIENTATION=+
MEEARAGMFKMAELYARFRSVPVLSSNFVDSYWPESSVQDAKKLDWDYHVSQRDGFADDKELEDEMNKLMNTLCDVSKPWWRMDFLRKQDGDGAVVFRNHHALADGLRMVRAMGNVLTFKDGSPAELALLKKIAANKEKGEKRSFFSLLGRAIPDFVTALKEIPPEKCSPTHDYGALYPPKSIRTHYTAWIPFSHIKDIRNKKEGATINDVLMTAFSAALRKYGEARGKPAEGTIRALCAFSLPDQRDPTEMYNNFLLPSVELPVTTPDRDECLKKVVGVMNGLKKSLVAIIQAKLIGVLGKLGLDAVISELQLKVFAAHSIVYSNVPGHDQPIYLFGPKRKVDKVAVYYPNMIPQAIFLSYQGQLSFSLITDEGQMPDSRRLVDFFVEEINSWHDEIAH